MLPTFIKGAHLTINGTSYAGEITNIELPDLERTTEDFKTTGLLGNIKVDTGKLGDLMLKFDAPAQTTEMLKLFGACGVNEVQFRINASAERDDSCEVEAVEILMRGRFTKHPMGKIEPEKIPTASYEASLTSFKYLRNGAVLFDIDILNSVYIVDNKDILAARRQALKI